MNAFLVSLIIAFSPLAANINKQPASLIKQQVVSDTTLVNALKTLFKLEGASSIKPQDQALIRQIATIKQASPIPFLAIKKIDEYRFKGKPNKANIKPYIQFQIWSFDNAAKAKLCFAEMKKWYEDKPPKSFFQYENKVYYFAAGGTYIYLEYGRKAYNKVVSYFDKSKIQEVTY